MWFNLETCSDLPQEEHLQTGDRPSHLCLHLPLSSSSLFPEFSLKFLLGFLSPKHALVEAELPEHANPAERARCGLRVFSPVACGYWWHLDFHPSYTIPGFAPEGEAGTPHASLYGF